MINDDIPIFIAILFFVVLIFAAGVGIGKFAQEKDIKHIISIYGKYIGDEFICEVKE